MKRGEGHLKLVIKFFSLINTVYFKNMDATKQHKYTSLGFLKLNKTLGYTALMGVPPKVQPSFPDIKPNTGLHCTHGCAT